MIGRVRPREEIVQGRIVPYVFLPYPRIALYVQADAEFVDARCRHFRIRERRVPRILYRREEAYDAVDQWIRRAEERHVE